MIIKEFNDTSYHQNKLRALKIAAEEKEKYVASLERQDLSLVQAISSHSYMLDVYNDLQNTGFDIGKLKILHETILKIAESNQISSLYAIDKFFKDIEAQYDAKLGFEDEKDRLKTEIQDLKEKRKKELARTRDQPFIGPIIMRLMQLGLSEDDMLENLKMLLNLFDTPRSVKNLALVMIRSIETKAAGRARTTSDDMTLNILRKAREELSELD